MTDIVEVVADEIVELMVVMVVLEVVLEVVDDVEVVVGEAVELVVVVDVIELVLVVVILEVVDDVLTTALVGTGGFVKKFLTAHTPVPNVETYAVPLLERNNDDTAGYGWGRFAE